MDFDFEMEWIIAAGLGILEGFLILWMMKYSGTGVAWRVISGLIGAVVGTFVTYWIINK